MSDIVMYVGNVTIHVRPPVQQHEFVMSVWNHPQVTGVDAYKRMIAVQFHVDDVDNLTETVQDWMSFLRTLYNSCSEDN